MTEEMQGWYRILGLEPGSSVELVKRTYRHLVKQWHPDQFHGHSAKTREANERLKDIIPAYENLVAFHNGVAPRTRTNAHPKPSAPAPKDARAQFEEGKRHQKTGENETALNWFRQAAERGYVDAMFELGELLFEGYTVKRDCSEAARWYRLAADKGHAESQFKLGSIYEGGYGLSPDCREALRWYLKAAEQGYAEAQLSAAVLYRMDRPGIKQDYRLADYWFRKAAAQGLVQAAHELGTLYEWGGKGVDKNFTEAASWYRLAAERGDEFAQENLACLYEHGLGVAKDEREADRLLRQCDAAGRYKREMRAGLWFWGGKLGHMYETGIGIERDLSRSFECYRKAAMWGVQGIMFNLAKLYATGTGTQHNLVEAFKWLLILYEPRKPEVKSFLQSLTEQMSQKQIDKAKRLASQFVPLARQDWRRMCRE